MCGGNRFPHIFEPSEENRMVPVAIELCRGGRVESRHRVALVVSDAAGAIRFAVGDPKTAVFPRSAVKPLQAIPLVESGAADAFRLDATELALACASHGGELGHVETVTAWLARLGLGSQHLACGAHLPSHKATAAAMQARGEMPSRAHNNCSGKHSGMLTTAVHLGEPVAGYELPDHPVQRRLREVLEAMAGERLPEPPAVDGCGIPAWTVSLHGLARMATRFADPVGLAPARRAAVHRLAAAMRAEPWYVAGTGRLCTALMQAAPSVLAKTGAEGVFWAALPELGLGLGLKVEDGATRAAEPALLAALAALGALDEAAMTALAGFANPTLRNHAGDAVGEIRVVAGWPDGA
jgi:L-asparaginase II